MVGSAARYPIAKTVHTVLGQENGSCTMPRLTKSLPKHRKHKASGQTIVTLDGRDGYLGPHGTKTSQREYDRLVNERQANG